MDRFSFYRLLGEAVYRIDGAYDVFSRSAGISPTMLWVLSAINDGKAHTQSQLCWDWNLPRTTVNTQIKELERLGYVTLRQVPGTRRELYVELTGAGRAYADQVLAPVYEAEEALFQRYFQGREPRFVAELNRFSTAMKEFFMTGTYHEQEEAYETTELD